MEPMITYRKQYSLQMDTDSIYTLKAHLTTLTTSEPSPDLLTATLRIGRTIASDTRCNLTPSCHLFLDIPLQLHIDHLALSTQRCSITLSSRNKTVFGIALVDLPKEICTFTRKLKLVQTKDKRAQLEVDFTLQQLSSLSKPEVEPKSVLEQKQNQPQGRLGLLKVRSNPSIATSLSSRRERQLRVEEEKDKQIERLRKEKEIYQQMYQLEKCKTQKASEFIASFVSKLVQKYPDIGQGMTVPISIPEKKKLKEQQAKKQQAAFMQQLQQANRCLHRQLQDYKTVNEQLKKTLAANNNNNNGSLKVLKQLFPEKAKKNKQGIEPGKQEQERTRASLGEKDLKQWMEESAVQRQQLHGIVKELGERGESEEKIGIKVSKIKTAINRTYLKLLSKGSFTRESTIAHKREINSIIEQLL